MICRIDRWGRRTAPRLHPARLRLSRPAIRRRAAKARWSQSLVLRGSERKKEPVDGIATVEARDRVAPGARTKTILAWLRRLVPAAPLVVSAVNVIPPVSQDVVVLDEDEVASGPLSLADALMRRRPASLSAFTTPAASPSLESPDP
jgi:hypothetical protein